MLELRMLPACDGDCLWIRWGEGGSLHQLLIDMGPEETGERVRSLLEALPAGERGFELLVITHVDRDHIGGVLTCLAEASPLPNLEFRDVWFNGWVHLDGGQIQNPAHGAEPGGLESMGPAQGERLTKWLEKQHWNLAFGGGPVRRAPERKPTTVPLAGGLKMTVLGPTPERLSVLKPKWKEEVQDALRKGTLTAASPGLEAYGSTTKPRLNSREALMELADSEHGKDSSETNGSSISLMLEFGGKRILLAADAFPQDLQDGLRALGVPLPTHLDAVKVPHHGSAKNLSDALVKGLETPRWLFSTDGSRNHHPDAVAIARLLRSAKDTPTLCFNLPSTYNQWWDSGSWRKRFGYKTCYGTDDEGLSIVFP